MLKKFIEIFLIFILSVSCNHKKEATKELFNENSENNSNKAESNAEQLYNKATLYFDNKQFEDSKKELLILKFKFPNSTQINKANILLKNIDLEFKKTQKEEQLIEEKESVIKENLFIEATKSLRKKTDKLEGISWYQDKTSPYYINKNGFYLYITSSGYSYPSLRLKIQYKDDRWLFIRKYQIFVDGIKYSIEPEYNKIQRDNGDGDIWEWLDTSVGKDEFAVLTAIKNGKDIKIRYISDKYHKDKSITVVEKKAIINMLNVYSKIGGEIH
ncbi:hypothetical protein [Flavobacterium sp.]|uniref:hypothetical protein n=1 Tax=Flavobacterium sp. TaxID=239 RepID=UPI004048E091